jgi:hypothetical protein
MFRRRVRGPGDETRLDSRFVPDPGRSSSERWTWVLLAAGVLLRVLEYSDNRQLYMDEFALKKNLVGFAFYDFHTPLTEAQLAPPGFLALERLMILLPLPFPLAARLVPFLCSIASMFLMRSVARRYLTATAVPIAVGLFALTDWMLYYSVEIKQYSSDILLTLCALLLPAGAAAPRQELETPKSRRELTVLAAFGAIGVWFSHPLALVLSGVGLYLIFKTASQRDWKHTLVFTAISLLWFLSFTVCYRISLGLIADGLFLDRWWSFAFLPFPPRCLAELKQIFWQSMNVFNSPSGILTPLGVLPSAFISAGLFLIGAWSLGRRWRGGLILLILPILITFEASALHRYPFHGRLLLFLTPSVYLLVGEGTAALSRPGGPKLAFALGAFLLAQPAFDVFWYRFIQKRHHGNYDSHGDLHPDLLDYLEDLEETKMLYEMIGREKAKRLEAPEPPPANDQAARTPP